MNADDFRDCMLSFLRYLSDNYEAATKKELGRDYAKLEIDDGAAKTLLGLCCEQSKKDGGEFERQVCRKVHYVIKPDYLWNHIVYLSKTQSDDLLNTLQ
jgi:type I restriction enzyme M protein